MSISQVLGRTVQGMTRPFVCLTDSGRTCYVKGAYAGRRSLCCEWVAGRLAQILLKESPLGVPTIAMADVSTHLIQDADRTDIKDLGEGLVFASMRIEKGQEVSWSAVPAWPEETKALLLLLDLWLQNEDRSLSALGGNPNLLMTEMLWAYDFNLAFDEQFNRPRFFGAHICGETLRQWPAGFRERMEPRLRAGVDRLPEIFAELPVEWLHLDGDDSLPVQLDQKHVYSLLSLPFTEPDTFWKLP